MHKRETYPHMRGVYTIATLSIISLSSGTTPVKHKFRNEQYIAPWSKVLLLNILFFYHFLFKKLISLSLSLSLKRQRSLCGDFFKLDCQSSLVSLSRAHVVTRVVYVSDMWIVVSSPLGAKFIVRWLIGGCGCPIYAVGVSH